MEELVKKEIIISMDRPNEWENNLFVIQKPDSSLNICLNSKELNTGLVRKKCQIPTMEDISVYVVELKYGYCHIKFDEKSSKHYTFCIPFRNYRFL